MCVRCLEGEVMRRLVLAMIVFLSAVGGATAEEVRGLWVVRTGLFTPETVDRVVDQAVAGGFNTLLVQVRGRGDAFYRSRVVPRSTLLQGQPADFDPLARILERAHARHLRVHAWVNVLLTAHFGQPVPDVLLQHPDWAMVPRSAARAALGTSGRERLRLIAAASVRSDVEGYYLSPSVPGVGAHLEQVVRELVRRYPIDGVHLDFIRYPTVDFDYSRSALESFASTVPGRRDLLSGPTRDPAAWEEHRRVVLTALADRLSRAARSERKVLVSAAVVASDVEALHQKFQAWPTWVARGIVDAVCPMAYTPDPRLFREQIVQARRYTGAEHGLWAGVGAYRLTIDTIMQDIRSARDAGASGVVLFSHESLDAAALERLRKDAFEPAEVALTSPR